MINSIDSYGWFQKYFRCWLGRRSLDDKRQIVRWKGTVCGFKGKLVKMMIIQRWLFYFTQNYTNFAALGLWSYKNELFVIGLMEKNYCEKPKINIIVVAKKKLLHIILQVKKS